MESAFFITTTTLLFLLLHWDKVHGACPREWIRFRQSCYYFSRREVNWNAAQTECVRHGAQLVKIETQAENEFLRTFIGDNGRYYYGYDMWLGARKDSRTNTWSWSDGTPMDSGEYDDWQAGKPGAINNACLEFESEYNNHWNDDYCDELNLNICERPFSPLTPPPLPGHDTTTPAATTANVTTAHQSSVTTENTTSSNMTSPDSTSTAATTNDVSSPVNTTKPVPLTTVGSESTITTPSGNIKTTSAASLAGSDITTTTSSSSNVKTTEVSSQDTTMDTVKTAPSQEGGEIIG